MRQQFEQQVRDQLEAFRIELAALKQKTGQAETNLELEYYTLIDELRVKLEAFEKKYELLREVHDDEWQAYKTDLEKSWESLRELIKAITSP